MADENVYELVPMDPVKKLELEIEKIKKQLKEVPRETTFSSEVKELISELISLAKTNQEVVSTISKTNVELQAKLSEAIVAINSLVSETRNLVEILKEAAVQANVESEKQTTNSSNDLLKRLENLERLNLEMINILKNIDRHLRSGSEPKRIPPRPPVTPKPVAPQPFIPPKI